MEIEHIVFDLDGTLADSLPGIECSARHALSRVLPGCTLPELRPLVGPPIFEAIYDAIGPALREKSTAFESCFRSHYDEMGWQQSELYSGAVETIRELNRRNVCCHVVTNKPKLPTGRILDRLGLRPYMTGVVCRDSRNPCFQCKSRALKHLMAKFAIRAGAAIMVGDSADDAHAAVACGLPFAAATWGYGDYSRPYRDPCLPEAALVLPNLPELLSLVQSASIGSR
jgi:phosphoglycolate phosphatase